MNPVADSGTASMVADADSRRGRLDPERAAALDELARRTRRQILETLHEAGTGHVGGPLSVVEILVTLYFHELRVDPLQPTLPDRDRLVFSKGHAAVALYAVLAERGYLPIAELRTFDRLGSRLQAHPDMTALPGLDMSTGSLGQGLSAGVGMAHAARLLRRDWRTYVVMGDGESQEGQVWEAAFVAGRDRLDSLVAVLDWNHLQQYGWHEPGRPDRERLDPVAGDGIDPAARWRSVGWHAIEVDGHDVRSLAAAFDEARATPGRPTIVLARTVKGRGVSFMEGDYLWHSRPISDEELGRALEELS
jgi:transketolase